MFQDLFQTTGLSLDRLRSFWMVAEANGVTKAAGGDANRQSLFSRQIKELEEFFGVELIRREGRGIKLTPEGRQLKRLVQEQFATLQDFRSSMRGCPITFCIGAGDSLIHWILLPRLRKIRSLLTGMRLKVMNLSTNEIVDGLWEGTVDAAVVREGAVEKPLKSSLVGIVCYSLFVPLSLLQDKAPDETLLGTLPLATIEGDGSFKQGLSSVCRKLKAPVRFELEFSSFAMVAKCVNAGLAAAVLPSLASVDFQKEEVKEIRARST